MQHRRLVSRFGYEIPCMVQCTGSDKTVLVCHGFGSSKDSPMIQALRKELSDLGVDMVSFDFPQHGDSAADGKHLLISCCLSDLQRVEEDILRHSPNTELIYFGSSFGAYITLLSLSNAPHAGKRAFLRSAAVDMHQIILSFLEEGSLSWQSDGSGDRMQDYCTMDLIYGRPFFITRAFVQELAQHDLLNAPLDWNSVSLSMIHGALDRTAPLSQAQEFARHSGASLCIVPLGEHRLMGPGEMDLVLASFTEFVFSK